MGAFCFAPSFWFEQDWFRVLLSDNVKRGNKRNWHLPFFLGANTPTMFCYQSRTVQSHGLFFSWLKPAADTKRLSSAVYRRTESVTGWIFTANVAKSRVTHAPLSYSTSRFKRRLVRCLIRSRKQGIAERLCNSAGARVCREALGCELQVGEGDGTRRREETTTDVSSVGPLCSSDGRPTHETLYVGVFFCAHFSHHV